MKIELPGIPGQQRLIFEMATREAIKQLEANLHAPSIPGPKDLDEALFPRTHLLRKHEGWEAPHAEIVRSYFRHFQDHFDAYATDKKLAGLLRIASDRRIRKFKEGSQDVPYEIWRNFLILTGRVPQDIVPILAFMG
ncbi:Orf10 [Pseudomonas syringae pv. actinidiae ICMP 19073]|uniref:hypothetical protein n=1 Tax=Pseudomonas syringae TaxID=317 RepID=UPI000357F069|nr:hypothetical protein [Pseudomonas syringae]EPM64934.1 Orf10 [Pseudomonas syringae pv. actinidiae ICMP 19073]